MLAPGLFVAFDPVLRRQVWIHTVPPGTPAVSSARRDVGRAGRLFWLTGHRSDDERDGNWDAYEAPDGEPFLKRQRGTAEWATLKLWLMDLANEPVAGAEDGSAPALGLDRVWLRNDERLVLLDYRVRDNIWIVSIIDALRESNPPPDSRLANSEVRDAFEKYLAGTHGATLNSDRFWSAPIMQSMRDRRVTAQAILARYPSVPAEELARVTAMIAPDIERMKQGRKVSVSGVAGFALVIAEVLTALAMLLAMSCSLVSALIVPGGIVMRMLRLAVVKRDGTEITRLGSLARSLVAWLPAVLWLVFLSVSPKTEDWVPVPPSHLPTMALLGILLFGAIWAIVKPTHSIYDRLMGTWIVPR